jgi:hypothetical protein
MAELNVDQATIQRVADHIDHASLQVSHLFSLSCSTESVGSVSWNTPFPLHLTDIVPLSPRCRLSQDVGCPKKSSLVLINIEFGIRLHECVINFLSRKTSSDLRLFGLVEIIRTSLQ